MKPEIQTLLATLRAEHSLSEEVVGKLLRHAELVLKWGRAQNLTGARDVKTLLAEHTADALPLCPLLAEGARVLDVGSGAGFPGVVLCIVRPDLRVTLLEKNYKKAVFLRAALRDVGAKAEVVEGDAKAPPEGFLGAFDVTLARAVFSPEEWVGVGEKFLTPGGSLVAFLSQGARVPEAPRPLSPGREVAYTLPTGAARLLAFYQKGVS